ncbi:hypothetical protein Hdeb2414_s0005g00170811 [Helianthus debilis subsp. tardiflorus]
MEFALEKIMEISQEGTVKEYCNSFQILFNQVRNLEEISEFYAIYLFICGLEPKIRKIFARWHQYSCTTVKDVISLALKIDSNGLRDFFSPFDPNSSFYNKDLEFDINITLEELMKDNELFRNGKIQETCANLVQETIVDEVIDYVYKNIEDDTIQDKCSEDKLYGEISNGVGSVIQESIDSDQVINEDMGNISIKDFQGNEKDDKNNQVQIGEKGNVIESVEGDNTVGERNACVGLQLLYSPQNSHYITGESMSVYEFILYEGAGSFHCGKQSKGSRNSESSQVSVPTEIGVGLFHYRKQLKWIDTGWACNLKYKGSEILELKIVELLIDKNRVWDVGLQLGSDLKVSLCKSIRSEINKLEFMRVDTFEWKPGWKSTLKMGFLFRASWFMSFIWVPLSCYTRIIRSTGGTFEGHTTCVFIVQSITCVARLIYYGVDSLLKLWTIKATRGRAISSY